MRKGFLMVLAVALVAVLAAPAVAGVDINGFYRAKGYVSNFKTGAAGPPSLQAIASDNGAMGTAGYVEQRFRIRFSIGEENVKAVWFSEIDISAWGDSAGSAANSTVSTSGTGANRNSGGALGADRINLETKNVYVWFKVPDTSMDFTVGLQNQTDNFQGLFYGAADMGGIFATGKYEPISWKLGWAKFYENSTLAWDDTTLYMGLVNWAPSKDVKLGFSLYYLQDTSQKAANSSSCAWTTATVSGAGGLPITNPSACGALPYNTFIFNNGASSNSGGTTWSKTPFQPIGDGLYTAELWTPGIDFAWNAGSVQLSGFFLYQFGTLNGIPKFDNVANKPSDVDVSGLAADLRVDANLGPGKFFIEGLFVSGGDNENNKYGSILTTSDFNASPGGNSAFTRMDFQLLMGNADDINTNQCIIGCAGAVVSQSPGNSGRGMWAFGLGYSMKANEKTTVKLGAGYAAAVQLIPEFDKNRNKDMGTEVNGMVNYNIMKGLDFGLYAAYLWTGDFLKYDAGLPLTNGSSTTSVNTSKQVHTVDNMYDLHFRLNYAF